MYQPVTPDANESTAFFLTHEDSNFIDSIPCVQLAQRGYTVFCVKSQYLDPCSSSLAGMPPADRVILLDAILGIAFDRLTEMDGRVARSELVGGGRWVAAEPLASPRRGASRCRRSMKPPEAAREIAYVGYGDR